MSAEAVIEVVIAEQRLRLWRGDEPVRDYAVATAANGAGEEEGSFRTPRGWHRIRAKIGGGCPEGTVFVGRRATGERYSPALRQQAPERDWILTRILWLCGEEPGRNRFGRVDTMRRYVYIHGAPDEDPMGVPSSKGCIKMRGADIIDLFERVPAGTRVLIKE